MRINYINGLRLIATLGVVFLHASAGILDLREIPSPTDKFMHTCFKYSMQFAVPIFVRSIVFKSSKGNRLSSDAA